jgi:hypothetical protein
MDYPVQVDVRLEEGTPGLDALQREGAASLISSALPLVSAAERLGGSAVGLAGFRVTTHPRGARLALSLEAAEPEVAERAARQIAERVLRSSAPLSDWQVAACQAGLVDEPAQQGRHAAGDRGAPPADPDRRAAAPAGRVAAARKSAAPQLDWGEIAEVRARMAAGAPRLRAFGLEAFGYLEDDAAGSGVSREAGELAAGALVHSIGPMLETLFDDSELLRDDATAADRSALVVLDGLSPQFAHRYDACFARRFLVAAASVTGRLTRPTWEPPACVAEELALRLLIDWAEASLEELHLLGVGERDAAYSTFARYAFDGAGHELRFEPRFDGIDSDPSAASRPTVPARVAQWFEPFSERRPVHAYALGAENTEAPPVGDDPPADDGPGDRGRETELIGRLLADRVGIDPGRLDPMADLLAIGLVHGCWRNTCVEDWHASGRLSDADMLRISSHLTKRVREHVGAWAAEKDLSIDGPTAQLDALTMPDVEDLARGLLGLLTSPARRLPNGTTLAELAGSDLGEYEQEAALALGGFTAEARARGIRYAVTRSAGHGGLACPHWWSHPKWAALVSRFIAILDEPGSEHWGPDGEWRRRLPPEPLVVQDRNKLRCILLAAPWELSTEAAEWIGAAGIGLLRHRL